MDLSSRYEILDTIARGDFATVLRARDRELAREVAIKQIHEQFLADQEQLARYWREAQLLASLQHPNILTIYDIVRSRGWLILELMQGSLRERAEGDPLDFDSLRIVLAAGLNALHFLHSRGITHGDVKPGNLLFDRQNRIKLGDFGLARRVTNEEGSLLKGTTKYMAPELVSEQFGAVGPASDVYSLGFSVYELICGSQFESLFPGLATFGRDRQIAWMMWHTAADRKLPEIGRVLEGVPDDLARIIEKMAAKDQAQRYGSAQEALRDLTAGPHVVGRTPEEEDLEAQEARAAAAKAKRRRRLVAVFALVLSATVSAAILFTGEPTVPPSVDRGRLSEVDFDDWKLTLVSTEEGEEGTVRVVSFTRHDRFLLNGEPVRLEDLRPDDEVVVRRVRDETSARWITEVRATRPVSDSGRIKTIAGPLGGGPPRFLLTLEGIGEPGEELVVGVPGDPGGDLVISLNGQRGIGGRAVEVSDLAVGDRVVVRHVADGRQRKAIELAALRIVRETGVVCRDIGGDEDPLKVELSGADDRAVRVYSFAEDCRVTINGLSSRAPTDLRQGDQVTFDHDAEVVSVSAYRVLHDAGRIEAIRGDAMSVLFAGEDRPIMCGVDPQCTISLSGESVGLTDLRRGDTVQITHDSLNRVAVRATEIAAERPSDERRWAILIGIQDYSDAALSPLAYPAADAALLRDVLVSRYWVPDTQVLLLTDEGGARLRDRIPQQLDKMDADDTLLVYVGAHAYRDERGIVYLAPVDFRLAQIGATGLPLQWLLDQLEECRAGSKLLLLDCSHAGAGDDLQRQPSSAEMIGSLVGPPGWAALRTVDAVASCAAGERGQTWDEKRHGLFAWALAQGYAGEADRDRDLRIDPAELVAFLGQEMGSAGGGVAATQTATLIEADARPPRLDEEAKREVLRLAEHLRQERIDVDGVESQYSAATASAGAEPEPELLYGLLLLKDGSLGPAREKFAELKIERPNWLMPRKGIAWAWFDERVYTAGVGELGELVSRISRLPSAEQQHPEHVAGTLIWIGRLRQFAEIAAERHRGVPPLAELDDAVAALGTTAETLYEQGREQSRDRSQQIEAQAETEERVGNRPAASRLRTIERYRLEGYVPFPFDEASQQIAEGLDRREPEY